MQVYIISKCINKSLLTAAILAVLYVATVFATCRKNCSQTNYSFEIGAKAYPDLDSIRVGDTVWIEVDEPVLLKNQNTNANVQFYGAVNLGTVISFIELEGNQLLANAANDFDLTLKKGLFVGNSTVPNLLREYLFVEENNAYVFKLGVIAQRAGIFRIGLSDAANVYRKGEECSKATFRINFKESNQHMYLNEQNFGVSMPLPNSSYCFKVK